LCHQRFAEHPSEQKAGLNVATQRPLRDAAVNGEAGARAWQTLPSWFIFPERDLNIPLAVRRFIAERVSARETSEVPGASHSLPIS